MATIQQYYDYSQLAMGSYAVNLSSQANLNSGENPNALKGSGFVQQQIDALGADTWQVVHQSEDSIYGSGFSATLFLNTQTGEYVFSNRGTVEFVADLLKADVWGITLAGTAGNQIVDMIRYYKRLITPQGQAVQYSPDVLADLYGVASWYRPGGYSSVTSLGAAVANDTGLGKLSASQALTVTGHSLGGHLSIWFKAFYDSIVNQVYTFNGAGLGGVVRSAATAVAGLFGNVNTIISDSRVTNIFGDGGPAIISGVGGNVGTNIGARIEAKGSIDSLISGLYNHSIVTLSDALSIPALLEKFDPTLTLAKTNVLLDASANEIGVTQESALDAVRTALGFRSTTATGNRNEFYSNFAQLLSSTAFRDLTMQQMRGKVSIKLGTNGVLGTDAKTIENYVTG